MKKADLADPRRELAALRGEAAAYLRYASETGLLAGWPREPETPEPAAADTLDLVAAEVAACTRCPLHRTRVKPVPGEGPASARLMVIGEGPGNREDQTGRPFVGEAGALLTRMLAAIDEPRETVFIANMVKCRPPGNRDPEAGEVAACRPFLERQLAVVNPLVVLVLGRVAAHHLLDTTEPISRLRGKVFRRENLEIYPTFHPAYLLRSPGEKRLAWEDLQRLKARLEELRQGG